jgi:hypothetical protein
MPAHAARPLGAAVKAFFYNMKNGQGKGFDSYCQPQTRLVSGLSVIASEAKQSRNQIAF